jgi:hypothetical protein
MRVAIVLVTLLGGRLALAQPAPELPPAGKLFLEGRELLEAGKAAEACAKFEESYKLDSTAAGTMLNLGLCHEQVGKLATALKWFRRAQTRAAEHGLTDTETSAREKSAALAAKIATIKLAVSAPAGRTVTLDGNRIDEVDFGRLEVDAGAHVFELVAPGAPTVRREIEVVDGTPIVVQLSTAVPVVPKTYEVVDVGAGQRRRAYVLGGVGAALLLGSGALGYVGKGKYDDGQSPKDWDHWQSLVRYGGTSLFILGATAATYAVLLHRRAPGSERREVVATPVITNDQVGFAFVRPF